MNDLAKASVSHYVAYKKGLQVLSCLVLSLLLLGCTSLQFRDKNNIVADEFFTPVIDATKPKSIFVFMDGTSNTSKVPTNVYRLFEAIKNNNDKQTIAYYIEGVGNANDPIGLEELAGKALGFGMEEKILKGYKFVTENYRPNDRIYIFGFSRGAHTARSLAGLISYAGIPKLFDDERNDKNSLEKLSDKILTITQDVRDGDYADEWKQWKPGDMPLLANLIREKNINGKKGREIQPAEVRFLGVWDTVPGSTFKDDSYFKRTDLSCKESIGIVKKLPGSIPGIAEGERYKIDSYPAIRNIAHAVSNDEKRSMFRPLFLCSSMISPGVYNSAYTVLNETIFPGAHADVGGGYEDLNNDLPNISLNWMISLLEQHYDFPASSKPQKLPENPEGLAHLSISDKDGSKGSTCIERKFPPHVVFHESNTVRDKGGAVPWLYFDKKPKGDYPDQSCKEWVELKPDEVKKNNLLCIKQSSITCSSLGY